MAEPPLWYKYKNYGEIVEHSKLQSGTTYFLIGNDTKTGFVKIVNNGKDFQRVNDNNFPPISFKVESAGTFYEGTIKGGKKSHRNKSHRNKSRRNKSRRNKKTRKHRRKTNRRVLVKRIE